jgi:Ca2+-binding EF-hand superfamily protein
MRAGRKIFVVGLGVLALAACSTPEPQHRKWNPNAVSSRSEDWHSPVAMLLKYDADHDGTLTRKELEVGLKRDFDAADKEHTGCLNSEEVTAINEERMSYDESAASPLIDFKNRGCIDFDEYAQMARSLFEQLDTDSDGELSPKERHSRPRKDKGKTQDIPEPDHSGGGGGGRYPGGGGY